MSDASQAAATQTHDHALSAAFPASPQLHTPSASSSASSGAAAASGSGGGDSPVDTPSSSAGAMPRNAAAAMRAIMSLQSTGAKLVEAAASRERVLSFMSGYADRLGLDLRGLPPVIHIAGTKGKGSTASMVEAILRARGLRTGLYTSPHLIDIRERFRVDGAPVREDVYLRHFWRAWDALQAAAAAEAAAGGGATSHHAHAAATAADDGSDAAVDAAASLPAMPGFFHFLTLLAFSLFRDGAAGGGRPLDVAVLEVGMGGRLDATNVVPGAVVAACGVTTLDFDHMDTLGHTLPEIAAEKAGIFKPGVPAITVPQRPDALARLTQVAAAVRAPLLLAEPSLLAERVAGGGTGFPELGLAGTFQHTNAALAVALAETFLARREALLAAGADAPATPATSAGTAAVPAAAPAADAAEAAVTAQVRTLLTSVAATLETSPGALPVPYRVPAPPAPFVLDGLRAVRWSGRAQVVDVNFDAATGRAAAVVPSGAANAAPASVPAAAAAARLYIDGAHTERSLRACVSWFRSQVGLAAAPSHANAAAAAPAPSAPAARDELVLLFYCGTEKDALQLLLPLSSVPFDRVVLAAPDWTRPSRHGQPSTRAALAQFLEKKRRMGDGQAVADVEAAAAEAGLDPASLWSAGNDGDAGGVASGTGTPTPPATPSSGGRTDPSWLRTLGDLWAAVHTRPEFSRIRRRLAAPMASYSNTEGGRNSDASSQPPQPADLPSVPPPVTIATSVGHALSLLQPSPAVRAAGGSARVLVTGSLYLVGGVLQSLGWSEDAAAAAAASAASSGAAAPAPAR